MVTVDVGALDYEGRGVARVEGKAVFVEGALPGERVVIETLEAQARVGARASTVRVETAAAEPGAAALPAFRRLRRLRHPAHRRPCAGRVQAARARGHAVASRPGPAQTMLPPIEGPAWGYRFRARLTVRDVAKKGGVLVGFHERGSSFVADMTECHTMPVLSRTCSCRCGG